MTDLTMQSAHFGKDTKARARSATQARRTKSTDGPRFKSRMERAEYWLIFVPSFAAFLVSGCVSRLIPRTRAATKADAGPRPSLFKEAWSAADTTTSYAFMG
jgi:hypothetical protein